MSCDGSQRSTSQFVGHTTMLHRKTMEFLAQDFYVKCQDDVSHQL